MSERLPGQENPFLRLTPRDFEPPDWDALPAEVLGRLTEEGGPGIVTEPVVQRDFASPDELIPDYEDGSPGNSGITYYFEKGSVADLVQAMPVFRRFKILYPDLVQYLSQEMAKNRGNAPKKLHGDIFAAYRIMRHLVDLRDPYVISTDGVLDRELLIR